MTTSCICNIKFPEIQNRKPYQLPKYILCILWHAIDLFLILQNKICNDISFGTYKLRNRLHCLHISHLPLIHVQLIELNMNHFSKDVIVTLDFMIMGTAQAADKRDIQLFIKGT